jgi:hypothetical protein
MMLSSTLTDLVGIFFASHFDHPQLLMQDLEHMVLAFA